METEKLNQIIEDFINFIESDLTKKLDRDKILLVHLDSLGFIQAHLDFIFDENDYEEPPLLIYDVKYNLIKNNFNNYGCYNLPEEIDENISETNIIVGDAIDDIVDIYLELKEIQWRFIHTSQNDALWNLENNYKFHWGTHLRNLQRYVYFKHYGN